MNRNSARFPTAQAAKLVGISKSTLLRWIRNGLVADVQKDRKGWRRFSSADIDRLRGFNEGKEPAQGRTTL